MMRRGGERGVTVQIGAVLLLAILFTALALYQVNAVPAENEVVEINHNEEVQADLLDVRDAIVSVPGGNSGGSRSVTLGTSYPTRTFALNPGPMSGTVQTEEIGDVHIENATVVGPGEIASDWEDGYSTRGLTYAPEYNEFQDAPRTNYEHGLLYNRHPNGATTDVSGHDQPFVDGNEITIVTVQGNLTESGSGTASIDVRDFSTSRNTVSLESSAGDPLTITLPTAHPEHWNETLSEETDHRIETGDGSVTVTFTDGTYTLRLAEVGVGDATRAPPEERVEYLASLEEGSSTKIVEFRDRFNNPVRNAQIAKIDDIDELIDDIEYVTDPDGLPETTGTDGRVRIDTEDSAPGSGQLQTYGWTVETDGEDGAEVFFTDDGTEDGKALWDLEEEEAPAITATAVSERDDRAYTAEIVDGGLDNESVTVRTWRSTSFSIDGHRHTDVGTTAHVTATVTTDDIDGDTDPPGDNDGDGGGDNGDGGDDDDDGGGNDDDDSSTLPTDAVAYHDENGNGRYDDGEATYAESDLESVEVQGSVVVIDDAFRSNGMELSAAKITVEDDARLETQNGGIHLSAADEITVAGTVDTTPGSGQEITLNSDSQDGIDLSGGSVLSSGSIDVDSDGSVTATDGSFDATDASYGSITITGNDIALDETVVQTEGEITAIADGSLDAAASTFESTGNGQEIYLESSDDDVSIEESTIQTAGPITAIAAGSVDATGGTMESTGTGEAIYLESSGNMVLDRVTIDAAQYGLLTGELNRGSNALLVDDAVFRSAGEAGTFEYTPNGVDVIGEPDVGSTE